jgi:hypothetical protein
MFEGVGLCGCVPGEGEGEIPTCTKVALGVQTFLQWLFLQCQSVFSSAQRSLEGRNASTMLHKRMRVWASKFPGPCTTELP